MLPLKVLIADDHRLFRQGLISLMSTRPDLVEVVGQAETGSEAIRLTAALRPDLVLMDIFMPHGDGLTAAEAIRCRFPDVDVVILTASQEDEHFHTAIRIGVAGYLLKDLDAAELFSLIRGVERGEAALTRAMATRLLKDISTQAIADDKRQATLTGREVEVLCALAQGSSNSQIAEELNITVNTVKTHISHILNKLQLDNRTQAATYAIQSRIVTE